jgi:polyisoprenoid-binding protein YceI
MLLRKSILLAATTALFLGGSYAAQAADTYTLDASHTAIVWHVNHFGFSTPSGKFMNVEGSVTLDEQSPMNSSVKVTIPVADVNSGVPKLDEHLKTADFFDVAKFPTATFVSTRVIPTGKDSARVIGDLTLHGVTKQVSLDVTLNKIGENMMKLKTAGFTATTTIKRSDFGITTYVPALGDEVKLEIESEANIRTAAN